MITTRFLHDPSPDGRYLCGLGDGGGRSSIASSANPSPFVQPHLGELLDSARLEFRRGPKQFFPGSTVVPFSGQTEQGLGAIENRATAGNPLLPASQETALATIRGDYLDPSKNPAFQQAAGDIQSRVGGMFSGAGRYGSGAMANQANEALSRLAAQTYGAERQNQLALTQAAPQLALADYLDPQQLLGVGKVREGLAGAQLQEQMAQHQHEQNAMDETLRRFATLISGGNVQGQVNQPIYGNTGLQAAGLGLGALNTYGQLFGKSGAFPNTGADIGSWFSGLGL